MTGSAPERVVPDLSFMLAHAAHVLATRMTAAFARIGTTPRHYCVLNHAASGELTQIELARLSDLDKTTMVVTLDELEEAGYAERRLSRADRRARAGGGANEVGDGVQGEVLGELSPAGRGVFLDSLTELVGGLLAEPVACERPVRRARQTSG